MTSQQVYSFSVTQPERNVDYKKTLEKWAKRRQAIYDAHKVKGRPVKDVANAYGISVPRAYKIIKDIEDGK